MMDVDKVQILVQEGEGLTVEFKEHFTPRIDSFKSDSNFFNSFFISFL